MPDREVDHSLPGADERIVAATLQLLRDRGPAGVNVEAVAAASGVAKTTIYRRYEDREALLVAAIDAATTEVTLPTGLSTYDTLHWLLGQARVRVQDIVGRGTVAAILIDDDAPFTDQLRDMIRMRSHQLVAFLDEAVARGDLRAGLDVKLVVSVLLGSAVGHVIRGGEPDEEWADRLLTLLWPALTPDAADAPTPPAPA
ncbi:TetR/AcrR family transcriptional regulator [Herbiconiux daphne]|uniref:TetR/AcrR family transcriptional regulator n=1 Tax=Herbiconiux daphne TaxID=2970914 RepID=A0ABT2H111_9MICO|nr:TetR/AcrR family transcriptional regulator [Herbiconiux daphne]MCS5733628.1 TetR/AcrR family transcriptional regulator [Herbiconiux daphne]